MPTKKEDLPGTLKRSPEKAQRTYAKTLDSAEEQYDSEARAHQTAWSAVKHSFEKVGDHWEPKEQAGPSDKQAERSGPESRDSDQPTAQGVDANASKKHLVEVARKVGIERPERSTKKELVDEIMKANARATDRARRS